MQSKFSIPDTLSWWQMIITWGGNPSKPSPAMVQPIPWQGGSEAGPWSARKLWHLKVASLETKHLGGSAGPCHGHGGDWSLDSSKLGASNIQLSLLDWIFPELQGTHFLESFTFAGKSKVSCRFSLKEHVRDAVFSLNSFSGLWIMWLVVENGLYTPMILWPIQLEKPSARFVAKPELAQCVSLNSFGVKNFG